MATLAARVGPVANEAAPAALFAALHDAEAPPKSRFQERYAQVRGALPQVSARWPRPWEMVAGLAVYAAVLLLPLAAADRILPVRPILSTAFLPHSLHQEAPPRDFDAELARATDPETRWRILMAAGAQALYLDDEAGAAAARYREALAVAEGFPEGDVRRLDSRIALAFTLGNEQMVQVLTGLLGELRALTGPDRRRLAEVLEEIEEKRRAAAPEERMARLREAIGVREALGESATLRTQFDRLELAALLAAAGEWDGAEALLRAAPTLPTAQQALAWLLIERGRPDEAERLVTRVIAQWYQGKATAPLEIRAWALLGQGRAPEAMAELDRLLSELPPRARARRAEVLVDLIHMSNGSNGPARARRVEQLHSELSGEEVLRLSFLREQPRDAPWERRRLEARLAVVEELFGR